MTLIKELIDIPERVQKGDYVLKLVEDIKRPAVVLDTYVVTPELAKNFDAALTFIRSALLGRTSKATFLHGSFGTGKSHFMAVLDQILEGNSTARGIPELAPVIQKHNEWLAGKRFLLVPYHMINSHDMESGVLGGYVDFMRQAAPGASVPPLYMSATIIAQARQERESYGDAPFFRRLNAGQDAAASGGSGGWGELAATWDAASFEAAADSPPDSEDHLRLVSTLLKTVASSHAEVISHRGGNFVRFDKGLSIISQHAASLGYDAVILFLDELILWLAMNSADLGFVKREAAKLTNLVEAQSADRPIPLISFVARQRDLRELIGDHVPGAERLSFGDALDWQGGRFDTITLEDRNLPAIAEKRVLKCRDEGAKRELDAAFEQTARMKDNVMSILLTQEGDRQMFRKVYPFSPALVQTLIAVSSVLQRERTALKVMMQLLVDHRETLRVGDVVPVGDLFDVVAHGDEAFTQDMAIHFDNAKRLYHQKLLPMLERQHGLRREDVEQLAHDDPKRVAFRNDDRLVKTLLLSALVPEVESLRGLNAEKLAALNHGTIKSPVPGREGQLVLQRCRTWAAAVGEIRIGEESNPSLEKGSGAFCRNGPEGAAHKMDLSPFQLDGGERWRVAGGEPAADELLVQGQRVLVEGHRLIAPWSERVRYGSMKNGYHGGLSPQEMVVPIAVLSSTDSSPAGWHEQPVDTPAWWDEPATATAAPQQPAPVLKPKQLPPGALFDLEEVSCQSSVASCQLEAGGLTPPEWVARLLTSPVFEEQKRLGGRGLPADDVFAKLLGTLDRRGGKLTSVALARALEFPPLRLSGLLAKAQRVLNIDGYAVLSRDDASDTVELNRELLLKQFDLV